MSRTVEFSWEFPTTRVEGGPLSLDDIDYTNIQLSADGGATFTDLGNVPAPQTTFAISNVAFGTWIARFVLADVAGARSADVDFAFDVVDDSAPNGVVNVQVTIT